MRISPIVSEKASLLEASKVYTFKVPSFVNKIELKKAVETLFEVSVEKIALLNVRTKQRLFGKGKLLTRRPNFKKALVFLTKDSKEIDFEKIK